MVALSNETFTGSAGVQTYTFATLKFLSSAHLVCMVNGFPASFTINAARTQITIVSPAIAGGETIMVQRTTPATEAGRLVNFEDLSHVRQSDLDTSSLQMLYLAQEGLDAIAGSNCMMVGISGHWNATSLRVEFLATGVAATDAITLAQLTGASIAAGNLPAVSGANNDSSLAVVAGAWAVRTPSQMRVHFGLGTAALLNAGLAAGNVIQLDGSARYPVADGRNIDLTLNAITALVNLRYRSTIGQLNKGAFTPFQNSAATWSEAATSRLDMGTLVSLDNSGNIVSNGGSTRVELTAGTWEIRFALKVYQVNAVVGNLQKFAFKLTNDVDSAAQAVYHTDFSNADIESEGAANRELTILSDVVLLKLAVATNICFRCVANNASGTNDMRVDGISATIKRVSASFA